MNRLFDTKPKLLGVLCGLTLLGLAFVGLISGYQFGFSYIAIAGIIACLMIWGPFGLKQMYNPLGEHSTKYIIIGFIWNLVQAPIMALIVKTIGSTAANEGGEMFKNTDFLGFIGAIFTVIISLIGEELIVLVPFALLMYLLNKNNVSEKKSLIIVTIFTVIGFGMLHYSTYKGNIAQIIFIVGMARLPFNWVAIKTNSAIGSSITHIAYDLTMFITAAMLAGLK